MKTTLNKLYFNKNITIAAIFSISKHLILVTRGKVDNDIILDAECEVNESNISGCYTVTFDIANKFHAIRLEQDAITFTKEEYLTI